MTQAAAITDAARSSLCRERNQLWPNNRSSGKNDGLTFWLIAVALQADLILVRRQHQNVVGDANPVTVRENRTVFGECDEEELNAHGVRPFLTSGRTPPFRTARVAEGFAQGLNSYPMDNNRSRLRITLGAS